MSKNQSTGLRSALKRILTPSVWQRAHESHKSTRPCRWSLQPLLTVALLMTYCHGSSEAERFVCARFFYVACHRHEKRPGTSLQGFHKALARLPLAVLYALRAAVRGRLQQLFHRHWRTGGF